VCIVPPSHATKEIGLIGDHRFGGQFSHVPWLLETLNSVAVLYYSLAQELKYIRLLVKGTHPQYPAHSPISVGFLALRTQHSLETLCRICGIILGCFLSFKYHWMSPIGAWDWNKRPKGMEWKFARSSVSSEEARTDRPVRINCRWCAYRRYQTMICGFIDMKHAKHAGKDQHPCRPVGPFFIHHVPAFEEQRAPSEEVTAHSPSALVSKSYWRSRPQCFEMKIKGLHKVWLSRSDQRTLILWWFGRDWWFMHLPPTPFVNEGTWVNGRVGWTLRRLLVVIHGWVVVGWKGSKRKKELPCPQKSNLPISARLLLTWYHPEFSRYSIYLIN
jgi:hypothetical protein